MIVETGDGEWTINGVDRAKADPNCQPIMMDLDACATCPLAVKEPEEPPSPFLLHLLWLEGLQVVGAQFAFNDLSLDEWEGLKTLKIKRNEKQLREMKAK